MYLKRIELQGFKSFADKTVIEVNNGITGIVGPNGSGKSNISDAIRWVMGEQSAKALRGGKMEDVIFSGTLKRKPLGYAEVSMVFDNTTGFLPCEYAEVEITRRVFRSGESDYMINRSPCRLKDIHELFMDTGMGRDGYSIVGQGRIAEIVSQKSEERRSVFEEAAGISKYRYRKQEAERKLEHTEENLTRVRDILAELEGRVEPLHAQSEKAIKFLDLREELKGIEVSALLEIIDVKKKQAAQAEENYKIAAEQLENIKREHDRTNALNEELFESVKQHDAKIDAARGELAAAEARFAAVENERTLIENNIANARENIGAIENELENWAKRSDEIKAALSDEKERAKSLDERQTTLQTELDEAQNALRLAAAEADNRADELERARTQVVELGQRKSEARTKIEGIETLKASYEARAAAVERELAAAEGELEAYNADAAALERSVSDAGNALSETSARLKAGESNEQGLNAQIQERKNACNAAVSSYGEKNARLGMLREMERSLEGYARSVRELVSDRRSHKYKGNFIGVLSKLIKTDPQYITAVEIALGGAMQNIVVNNESDAKEAIEYLKRNRMGRVTFLPLTTQEGRRLDGEARLLSSKGAIAVAADLVRRDSALDGVVNSLLGRTLVVDNMDNAARIAKENRYRFKIVTLGGELLMPGGSITGGSVNKSQALLQRGEEIERLEKECAAIDKQIEGIENEIDSLTERLDDAHKNVGELRNEISRREGRLSSLRAEAEMKRNLHEITLGRIEKLKEEQRELVDKSVKADESKNELNSALYGSDGLIAGAEKLAAAKREALSAAEEERESAFGAVADKKVEIAAAAKDVELCAQRIKEMTARLENSAADYEMRRAQADEYEKKIAALGDELDKNKIAARAAENEIVAARARVESDTEQKAGVNNRLAEIRQKIKALSDSVFTAQEEVVRLESRRAKLEGDYESASNRLWDDYELTYNTALALKKDIGSITAAQKRITELKNKIKALGNINIDAIEEYKTVKQRYEFMSAQVKDMEDGKKNLEKLISEMLVVMRAQFDEKLKAINTNFGKIFADLFGGGHAGVRLSDPNDVLESGIEIEAQPPGKKLQSISLFSGGEHALTAIALLFALLKATPSPFIVLDEIEAALDDENVYRFADYVKNYDDSTQFIIITHRRGTMEAADILYGVTMQEKGVSKLLAMNLDDIADE